MLDFVIEKNCRLSNIFNHMYFDDHWHLTHCYGFCAFLWFLIHILYSIYVYLETKERVDLSIIHKHKYVTVLNENIFFMIECVLVCLFLCIPQFIFLIVWMSFVLLFSTKRNLFFLLFSHVIFNGLNELLTILGCWIISKQLLLIDESNCAEKRFPT